MAYSPTSILIAVLLAGAFSLSSASALTFEAWQATRFSAGQLSDPAISGPNADPDGDGRVNLTEYAFGLDPLISDQDESTTVLGPNGMTLTFPEAVAATDLLYHLEESPDLAHWITPNSANRTVLANDGTIRLVSIFNPNAPAAPLIWFNRLRVLITPDGTEPLAAPSRVDAKIQIPLKIKVGWNDGTKIETGFSVEKRVGPSGGWGEIALTGADINSFMDLDIVGSTEYTYRVSAVQGEYASDPSNEFTITTPLDTDGDGIPDDMEATYGTDPMVFSSGNNGIPDGWWIEYGMSLYSDPNADPDGDGRSNYQEFLDGTDPMTADTATNGGSGTPLPPSGLALTTLENGRNELTWANRSTASGIIIERTEDGASWQTVGVVAGTKTNFTDATAQPETVYFYRLVAFK